MQSLHRRTRSHNVVLKFEMTKAFDRVSWLFLRQLLLKFGFHPIFVQLILKTSLLAGFQLFSMAPQQATSNLPRAWSKEIPSLLTSSFFLLFYLVAPLYLTLVLYGWSNPLYKGFIANLFGCCLISSIVMRKLQVNLSIKWRASLLLLNIVQASKGVRFLVSKESADHLCHFNTWAVFYFLVWVKSLLLSSYTEGPVQVWRAKSQDAIIGKAIGPYSACASSLAYSSSLYDVSSSWCS